MAQDINWPLFLDLLKDHQIVPVIGSELILVKDEKTEDIRPLYDYLTDILSDKYKINPENLNFKEFILRLKKEPSFSLNIISSKIGEIKQKNILKLDHLCKLALVMDFPFFISTTIDDVFESVLKKERGVETVAEIDYMLHFASNTMPPNLLNKKTSTAVFKILGNICQPGMNCALTEEAILENIYSLKDNQRADYLHQNIVGKSLLFLGCDFPDWLLRFFIRTVSNEPYSSSQVSKIIADNYIQKDLKLSFFLTQFHTQIYHWSDERFMNPLEFIDKLYDNWKTYMQDSIPVRYEGTVFLSFNHADVEIVRSVKKEMKAQGLDVWMDEDKLQSGDTYDSLIKDKIIKCAAFIAFISQNSLNEKTYTNKYEWDMAMSRRKVREDESLSNSFLKPVIIDETNVKDERIPEVIRKLTIEKINTENIQKLIENVKQNLKKIEA
jgi:hypothetical protein